MVGTKTGSMLGRWVAQPLPDRLEDFRRRGDPPAAVNAAHVRLLGPVDVVVGGDVRDVPGPRRKAVLAVLAMHAGATVNTDLITDVVWNGQPPSTAANTLQRHVSYLRGVLGGREAIVAVPPGYRLQAGPEPTDVRQAEQIIAGSRHSRDPAETAVHLRLALALWRGQPLTDLTGAAWFDGEASRLERMRMDAVKSLVEARLALGEHTLLLPELEELAQQNPFDEDIRSQLMLALYRSGRQADALRTYQDLHRRLDVTLGIAPSPPLRDMQLAILRHDPSIAAPFTTGISVSGLMAGVTLTPLPPMNTALVGRHTELESLDEWLLHHRTATAVIAVSGPPGVGKTALAVHWSRHAAGKHFPDGHLYIDLGSSGPGGGVDPGDALQLALEALGVLGGDLPTGIDARTGLYRTLLAGRRILVVLDDARDAQQVRPLLPNSPGSAVLVTSRRQLTALVVTEGARAMTLDPLATPEALQMLADRLGRRVSAEPGAAKEIVERCDGLPLALAILCAHVAANPAASLERLAYEMRDGDAALRILSGKDRHTDLRLAIAPSYESLSPRAAALFRRLGSHPHGGITAHTAAAITGSTVADAAAALRELHAAHLLRQRFYDRHELPPLARTYAASLCR